MSNHANSSDTCAKKSGFGPLVALMIRTFMLVFYDTVKLVYNNPLSNEHLSTATNLEPKIVFSIKLTSKYQPLSKVTMNVLGGSN